MNPLISIIIPCYNQAAFLHDCINSLQGQTHDNWEAIIVNDGSTDETREIASSLLNLETRIRYIEQPNSGACAARNTGFRMAKGSYIQLLDADDKLEPDKLRQHSDYLEEHPKIDIVFGDARYFTTENPDKLDYGVYAFGTNRPWISALWQEPGRPIEKLLSRNLFPINAALLRANVFHKVGEWNAALERLQDWEYWIRCAAANLTFAYHSPPSSFALIRWHSASMTHDSAKGDRATIVLRSAIGPLLAEPSLRNKNFTLGFKHLKHIRPVDLNAKIFSLARANLTPQVAAQLFEYFIIAPLVLAYRAHVHSRLVRLYKRTIPWPIQQRLTSLSKFIRRR